MTYKGIPENTSLRRLSLKRLLEMVDSLYFPLNQSQMNSVVILYSLDKFPIGWRFSITNSWQKWMRADLTYEFRAYMHPEHAVMDFLKYVRDNKIDVKSLMERV